MNDPRKNSRDVFPATGTELTAKSWLIEAPLRMLMNNLHPNVAENPHELVVHGGIGRAARTWKDFDMIFSSLRALEDDQTLLVQSGKPVGVFQTHKDAPRVLGIVQGTYETFAEAGRQHYNGDLKGKWILTGGLGEWVARSRWPPLWQARVALPWNVTPIASISACAQNT